MMTPHQQDRRTREVPGTKRCLPHSRDRVAGSETQGLNSLLTQPPLHLLLLTLLSIAVYCNSLDGDFVHDDIAAIVNNKDVTGQAPWSSVWLDDFWGTNIRERRSHKSYRPLTTITFRLTVLMFGLSPRAFHLTNLFLHWTVVILLYHTATSRLHLRSTTSLVAAALFAVHPVHCEAVSGLVGRADVLAAGLTLLAFRSSGSDSSLWKVACWSLLALLCKETGIMALAIVAVWTVSLTSCKTSWHRAAKYWVVTAAMIYLRVSLNGSEPIFSPQDNPASFHKSATTRFLTFTYLWVFNSLSLLCPTVLSYDWQLGSVPLVTSAGDVRVLHSLGAGLLLVLLLRHLLHCADRAVMFSLLFMLLPFLPASNIFQTVGFVAAERTLYTPSLGWCVLVARGVERLATRATTLTTILVISLLLFSSARTLTRNTAWSSRAELFKSGLASTPNNAKVWYNYGNFLRDQEEKKMAGLCYKESVRLWPDYVIALNNLATVTDNQTDIETLLLKALHLDSGHATSLFNLADLYRQQNECNKSKFYFSLCLAYPECLSEANHLIHQCQSEERFDQHLIRDLTEKINKRNVNSKTGKYSLEKCTNRSQCL